MKLLKIAVLSLVALVAVGLVFSVAIAKQHLPEERGKTLFNDARFGGGTSGKSCNSCHPDGKGVENSADKKEFGIMGKKQVGLEAAVNFCIENALKGKAIDPKSDQMKDIVAYIKSLKGKAPAKEAPKKK
jgi:cytochrome c